MRTAREIYERYQVPPWLQKHQVRVAAVGQMVAARIPAADSRLVVSTCLLHDIGAIVKFDFSYQTHEALKALHPAEETPHWLQVQADIRSRYGNREREATDAILRELGFEDVRAVFADLGLANVPRTLEHGLIEAQIVEYSDMRAGPFGIVSMRERLADGVERYAEHFRKEGKTEESKRYPAFAEALEKNLFEGLDLRTEDITEEAVQPQFERLWDYEIA